MIKLPRVIDSNGKEIKRLHPIAESINEKIVPLSYATLQVMKDEAVDERSYVELYTINGFSGIYRTRAPQKDVVGDTVTLQLEHAISEVGDWLIQDAYDEEITVRNAFVKIFSHYRGNKWQLGSFTATETVHLDVDYDNILETMIGIVQQQPKYYMTFNFSTTPWTVSLAVKSNTISAEGRLSRNISNVIVKRDDKDLCTRVYVKGLPRPVGRTDDENAIGYMDADTQALYGIVEAQTGGTDLTLEQATRVAENYLALHKHPKISAEVEGYDFFYATGETIDKVEIAKKYRLTIPSKSVIVEDYITAINWRDVYNNPESVSIIVGDEQDPVMDFYKAQNSSSKSSRRSSKKQAKKNESFDQQFEITDQYGSILNQAGMHLDAYGMLVYARDNVNNIGSIIDQTASYIMTKVDDGDNDLHSEILQTQSMIRSAVWTANSEVFSYVDQTATYIQSVVEDTKNDLHSEVLQTQTMIRSAVWTANSEIVSYIDQTSTYIINVVEDTKNDIGSTILQTASQIRSEVHAANSTLYSYVDQTATYILDHVGERTGAKVVTSVTEPEEDPDNPFVENDVWVEGTLIRTWNDADLNWQESEYDWTQLAGTKLHVMRDGEWKLATDETVLAEDTDLLRTKDAITLVAHNLEYVDGEFRRNIARLDVRADAIISDVQEKVAQIGSNIQQTAREIRSEVHASNSTLYSYIDQTATYIKSVVEDTANDLGSSILQTASQIRSEVHAANSTMYSYIDQTASGIRQEVANTASGLRSSIQQEANRIGLVVEGTGSNAKIRPAQIVASINDSGSTILLDADKIKISGTTKLNDVMTIYSNAVGFTVPLVCDGNVNIISGSVLNLYTATFQGGGYVPITIDNTTLANCIKSASVSGDTLTLTPFIGNAITFSKPASEQTYLYKTLNWSGGYSSGSGAYIIMEYMTKKSSDDTMADHDFRYYTYDKASTCIRVWRSYNSQTDSFTGQEQIINCDPLVPSHSISLSQLEDESGSGMFYGKLYFSDGSAVSGSNRYWYFSGSNIGAALKTVYYD